MSSSIFVRFHRYISDRFPSGQMLPLSLVFGFACIAGLSLSKWILISSAFYLYLLELRLFDEFKDNEHDRKYYPDRPVQRGVITLSELAPILAVVLLIQLMLAVIFQSNAVLFIIVQIYTFIMSREFFLKKWMGKHFTINIILHESVTPWLFLYLMSYSQLHITGQSIVFSLVYGINFFLLEMGRKLLPREPTHRANDTYVERYSNRIVALIITLLSGLSIFLSLAVMSRLLFLIPLLFFLPVFYYFLFRYSTVNWQKYGKIMFITLIVFVFISLISLSLSRLYP